MLRSSTGSTLEKPTSNASKVPSVAPTQSRKKAFNPFKKLLEEKARQDEFKKVHVRRLVESRPSSGDEATDDEHARPPSHTGMDRQSDFIRGIDSNLGLGEPQAIRDLLATDEVDHANRLVDVSTVAFWADLPDLAAGKKATPPVFPHGDDPLLKRLADLGSEWLTLLARSSLTIYSQAIRL